MCVPPRSIPVVPGAWSIRRPFSSRSRLAVAAAVAVLLSAAVHAQGLPTSYDLRSVTVSGSTRSWISSIQDQGQFGDCWTFASAAAMDSSLLRQGILPATATPPAPVVSSWALSTANGAPESLIGPDYGHSAHDWGGFEFQAMAYVTRGQGTWPIPGTVASSTTTVSLMGGGPLAIAGTSSPYAFPEVFVNGPLPANIGFLIPATGQPPAFGTTAVTMLDQGAAGNVALPTPSGTVTIGSGSYATYLFDQGALDPQVQTVKQAILATGAVTTSMNVVYDYFFQTGTTAPYTNIYVNQSTATGNSNHEVTIIGWDDQFVVPAAGGGVTGTGAWIVQNSWGTSDWCNTASGTSDGTFRVSYNDAVIGRSGVASFTMRAAVSGALPVLQNEVGPIAVDYAQYAASTLPTGMAPLASGTIDGAGLVASGTVASVLTSSQDCTLTAIGVASQMAGTTVDVNLYSQWLGGGPGGTLLGSIVGAPLAVGYVELPLSAGVFLSANAQLVVELIYSDTAAIPVVIGPDVINLSTTGSTAVRSGLSYSLATSGTWIDLATMRFKNESIAGSTADGGILFAKGVVAVPEPAALGGLAIGAVLVACACRRSRWITRRRDSGPAPPAPASAARRA
jgi:hypothetical protein